MTWISDWGWINWIVFAQLTSYLGHLRNLPFDVEEDTGIPGRNHCAYKIEKFYRHIVSCQWDIIFNIEDIAIMKKVDLNKKHLAFVCFNLPVNFFIEQGLVL